MGWFSRWHAKKILEKSEKFRKEAGTRKCYRCKKKINIMDGASAYPDYKFYCMPCFKWVFRREINRSGGIRGYSNINKTYHRQELDKVINGKKVKSWKQVYLADDADGDEFIPIFYKTKLKSKNKHENR